MWITNLYEIVIREYFSLMILKKNHCFLNCLCHKAHSLDKGHLKRNNVSLYLHLIYQY